MQNKIISAFLGLATGDALGVPVEFKNRYLLKQNPVTDMIGYGTYSQPAGTWSDDSSLTFCLAESLCSGYSLRDISRKFVLWKYNAHWTARNRVFDIGISTSEAITKLKGGVNPVLAGGNDEHSNGNGSLMRILPLAFYLINKTTVERFNIVKDVSSLTHRHIRSVLACFIYVEYAILLIKGEEKKSAYSNLKLQISKFIKSNKEYEAEIQYYKNILNYDISSLPERAIRGSGYVVNSLEAVFWCLLRNSNYEDTVLEAVNLGEDTDTTAAIVGGLAGIIYGKSNIPKEWLNVLARKSDIQNLAIKFSEALSE